MNEACRFFNLFLDHPCEHIAVENPIPHGYAVARLRKNYDQIIQPYQHGNPVTKRTCLWLKGLPKLVESNNVKSLYEKLPKRTTDRTHRMAPGPDRKRKRSETYPGIAVAMAAQWTEYFCDLVTVE